MSAAKTRFPKVSLEELAKILPEQVLVSNGNENQRSNQKDKKRNKQQVAKASKQKLKA
jgi:hypothetical protein